MEDIFPNHAQAGPELERLRAENQAVRREVEQLRRAERRHQDILEGIPIGICITNTEGVFEYVNPFYARFYGYPREELLGQSFLMVVPEASREILSELHDKFFDDRTEIRGEWQVRGKDGRPLDILADAAHITDQDNRPKKVTFVVDITKLKRVEAELREAKAAAEQASLSKSEFIAGVSHEIRTPLNAIIGYADILAQKLEGQEAVFPFAQGIRKSAGALLSIINDILDLSKLEAGKLDLRAEPVNLAQLVAEVREMFELKARQKEIGLHMRLAPDLPRMVRSDAVALRQILLNLVGNAIKFTHRGYVSIGLRHQPGQGQSATFWLVVADTGVGIDPAARDLIFEPFEQARTEGEERHKGTGLGLAIVRRLVRLFGGQIEVDGEPGHGSTFSVRLPGVEVLDWGDKPEAPAAKVAWEAVRFRPALVLLVEDLVLNRLVMREQLASMGLAVHECSDGREALDWLAKASPLPAVVLADLMMPILDGQEMARALRADDRLRHLPLVAVTADALRAETETIRSLFDAQITKPHSKAKLASILSRFLSHERPGKEAQRPLLAPKPWRNPEFVRVFRERLLPLALQRLELPIMDEVEAFAQQMAELAERHGCPHCLGLARRLAAEAASYQVDKVNLTLQEIIHVCKTIDP